MEEDGEIRPPCCVRCGRWNHTEKECDETTTVVGTRIGVCCTRCGKFGHNRKQCKTTPVKKPWCMRCAGFGHTRSVCRSKRSVFGHNLERVARCTLCGLFGHTRSVCREERTIHRDMITKERAERSTKGGRASSCKAGSTSESSRSSSSRSSGRSDSSDDSRPRAGSVESIFRCDLSDV